MRKLFLVAVIWSVVSFKVSAEKTLSFCFERWAPYAYTNDDGLIVGESVELVKKAAARFNKQVSFVELPFGRCVAAVYTGSIAFMLHTDSNERLPLIDVPINTWQLTLAVHRKSQITDSSLLMFPSLTILKSRSYTYPKKLEDFLQQLKANIVDAKYYTKDKNKIKLLFNNLVLNRVDAMVVDRIWATRMIEVHSLPLKLLENDISNEPQFIGFHQSAALDAENLATALKLEVNAAIGTDKPK